MSSFRIFPSILESIKLAYKHKILWVFALVVTGATYTSQFTFFNEVSPEQVNNAISVSNSRLFSLSSTDSTLIAANLITEPAVSDSTAEDMPIEESSSFSEEEPITLSSRDYVFFQAMQLLQSMETTAYFELFSSNIIWLILTFILGLSVAIGVSFIVTSWAYASLVKGCFYALNNESYSLKELSDIGVSRWNAILKFRFFSLSIFMLLLFIAFVFVISPVVILPEGFVAVMLSFVILLIFLLVFIIFHYGIKFGLYFILFNDLSFKEAILAGFNFTKINFWRILFVEIVSGLLISLVVSVVLAVLRLVATYGVLLYPTVVEFIFNNLALVVPVSLFVGSLAALIMLFVILFSGYVSTYNHILQTKMFFALNRDVKENITNAI